MLSWGTSTDVTKCQLDEASAVSPPSLHCNTQTEEDTKNLTVFVHLLLPHFKVVGGFVSMTFKGGWALCSCLKNQDTE